MDYLDNEVDVNEVDVNEVDVNEVDVNYFLGNIANGVVNLCTLENTTLFNTLLQVCKKEDTNLLELLLKIKNDIEINIRNLSTIKSIRLYTDHLFSEWNMNDFNIYYPNFSFDYNRYLIELDTYSKLIEQINYFKRLIKGDNYFIDSEIKDNIILITTNCNECEVNITNIHTEVIDYLNNDNYDNKILIDLMTKPKIDYINYNSYQSNLSNEEYKLIVDRINNDSIPDTIQYIYSNYLICINLIRKEINYISNKLDGYIQELRIHQKEFIELVKDSDILSDELIPVN